MKVSINNKEIEASEAQVLLEGETLTLFEEGGKLFCKAGHPVAAASFAPDTVCLDFASTPEQVKLYRGIIESRMNIVPDVYFAFEDTEGTGICRNNHNQLTKCWKCCYKYRKRKKK